MTEEAESGFSACFVSTIPPPFQLFPQIEKLIGDWKRKILHVKYH